MQPCPTLKNTTSSHATPSTPSSPSTAREIPFFSIIQRIDHAFSPHNGSGWRPVVIGGVKMAARPETRGCSVRMNVQATTAREARFILKQILQVSRATCMSSVQFALRLSA